MTVSGLVLASLMKGMSMVGAGRCFGNQGVEMIILKKALQFRGIENKGLRTRTSIFFPPLDGSGYCHRPLPKQSPLKTVRGSCGVSP